MRNSNKKHSFCRANVVNISKKFQLHPPYGFWGDDLWTLFCKFSFLVTMATNQIQQFRQNSYGWSRTTQGTFLYNFCQNIYSEIEIKAYFHFSHFKSMEPLSYHSDESTGATAIKNIVFVEANHNVMNISTKLQLHPPYGFWGDDLWTLFCKFSFLVTMATNQISSLDKIHMVRRGLLKDISVKLFSKYLQWNSNKCQFPLFPLKVSSNYKLP